jgi:hypothetical protein
VLRETKLLVDVLEDKRRAKIVINKDYQPAEDICNRMREYESSYPGKSVGTETTEDNETSS